MARQRSVQGLIAIVSVNVVLMENVWTALNAHPKQLPAGAVGEGYLVVGEGYIVVGEGYIVAVAVALEVAIGLTGHGAWF